MRQVESLLSEEQWLKLKPLLPQSKASSKGGRPAADNRAVVEGILWILKTGARWRDLPPQYPSPSTCWRRLRDWEEQGVWLRVWHSFIAELDEAHHLEWEETFADGSFAPAKKGALEPTLDTMPEKLLNKVQRLILDRGYDSDPLRFRLQERGIDMICPHRRNRKKPKTQDGRKLRRYKRRWKVERTFAWFGNYRRLLVRWEHNLDVYRGFFHLACALIALKRF